MSAANSTKTAGPKSARPRPALSPRLAPRVGTMVVDGTIPNIEAGRIEVGPGGSGPFPGMPARPKPPEVPLQSWRVTLIQNRTHPRERDMFNEEVERHSTEIVKAHHVEGDVGAVRFYLNDDMAALFPVDRVVSIIKISEDT